MKTIIIQLKKNLVSDLAIVDYPLLGAAAQSLPSDSPDSTSSSSSLTRAFFFLAAGFTDFLRTKYKVCIEFNTLTGVIIGNFNSIEVTHDEVYVII